MATIEIGFRTFFTSDGAEAVPSIKVTIDSDEISKVQWADFIEKLYKGIVLQLEGAPFTNLRAMTVKEVDTYLADEKEKESSDSLYGMEIV